MMTGSEELEEEEADKYMKPERLLTFAIANRVYVENSS